MEKDEPIHEKYWLALHVYICWMPDGVVLLDLKKDKYLGLGGSHLDALASAVHGWPVRREGHDIAFAPSEKLSTFVDTLLREGVLTRDPNAGRSAEPVPTDPIDLQGSIDVSGITPRLNMLHVLRFLIACFSAAWALRWHSMEQVVNSVSRRKQDAGHPLPVGDSRTAKGLTSIFGRLRSFLYTRSNRCLFDSLALVNFLASYGQFPTWVVGITTRPFRAHSWVQYGAFVLDDSPDDIFDYTPILAV